MDRRQDLFEAQERKRLRNLGHVNLSDPKPKIFLHCKVSIAALSRLSNNSRFLRSSSFHILVNTSILSSAFRLDMYSFFRLWERLRKVFAMRFSFTDTFTARRMASRRSADTEAWASLLAACCALSCERRNIRSFLSKDRCAQLAIGVSASSVVEVFSCSESAILLWVLDGVRGRIALQSDMKLSLMDRSIEGFGNG